MSDEDSFRARLGRETRPLLATFVAILFWSWIDTWGIWETENSVISGAALFLKALMAAVLTHAAVAAFISRPILRVKWEYLKVPSLDYGEACDDPVVHVQIASNASAWFRLTVEYVQPTGFSRFLTRILRKHDGHAEIVMINSPPFAWEHPQGEPPQKLADGRQGLRIRIPAGKLKIAPSRFEIEFQPLAMPGPLPIEMELSYAPAPGSKVEWFRPLLVRTDMVVESIDIRRGP